MKTETRPCWEVRRGVVTPSHGPHDYVHVTRAFRCPGDRSWGDPYWSENPK